eukprot:g4512.t1
MGLEMNDLKRLAQGLLLKDVYRLSEDREATKMLYSQKGRAFQEELVIEFIEAMGLYPLGTLVKLSSGEKAVVVKQNVGRRLKPSVLVLDDSEGYTASPGRTIDLSEDAGVSIIEDLPAEAGLDPGSYSEVFEDAFKNLIEIEGDTKNGKKGFMARIFNRD